jgi:hypothetical protein
METLELLPIEGNAVGEVIDAQPVDAKAQEVALATVRTGALAPLSAIDRGIVALREQHGSTDYDITTSKGLALAKERRHAIRQARYRVPHIVKEQKGNLAEITKALEVEGERIIEALKAIEDPHHAKITAEETRLAEEKAKEQARVDALQAQLDKLRTTAERAKGKTSAEIRQGIEQLRAYVIDESAWAEFAERANMAKATALLDLQALADTTKAAEDKAAEDERIRKENDARAEALRKIADLTTLVSSCFGKPAAHIHTEADKLTEIALADTEAPSELVTARNNTVVQLNQMAAMADQMEKLQAAQAPAPAPVEVPATPVATAPVTSLVAANNAARAEIAQDSTPAAAPAVVQAAPAPVAASTSATANSGEVMTNGELCKVLGNSYTSASLIALGMTPVTVPKKTGIFWPVSDVPAIFDALILDLQTRRAAFVGQSLAAVA